MYIIRSEIDQRVFSIDDVPSYKNLIHTLVLIILKKNIIPTEGLYNILFLYIYFTEKPQPSPHCPRMHGYFAHEDPRNCNTFYYCVEGKYNMITCPEGLVFSEKTGICNWPDEAQKKGCGSRELFNFTCPKVDDSVAATHPRYPDTEDCQYFYVCVNGEIPRRSGCRLGQAFDERTGKCDWARKIPEWYTIYSAEFNFTVRVIKVKELNF